MQMLEHALPCVLLRGPTVRVAAMTLIPVRLGSLQSMDDMNIL